MMLKKQYINYFLVFLLITTFIFQIIPIPVENIEGSNNPNKFIFSGFYWTSMYDQLIFENYFGMANFYFIFLVCFILNQSLNKGKRDGGKD